MDAAGDVVGVFGGSGFYRFLHDVEEVALDTPHDLPPHRINYRANVWAMREVGARRILGPSACGSLKPELAPGTFVICDQFVDRTRGREDPFYDGPQTTHVSAAEPYCHDLSRILAESAREEGIEIVEGGTVVVIGGPRFSTP